MGRSPPCESSGMLQLIASRCAAACEFTHEVDLTLAIRLAILAEDFMEPNRRLLEDIGPIPGIPWKPGLCFAGNESPVDRGHMVTLRKRKDRIKGAACAARHVFGA